MSKALRIAHGPFGRVALLDMDAPLVRHAHPHCHVLIKAEGDDTQFVVRGRMAQLTRDSAVLINAWESHHYAHDSASARTIILALYIEPVWLGGFRRNWIASGSPGFFEQTNVALPPNVRRLADEMAMSLACAAGTLLTQEALLSELMIAVIERFTPWREIGTSLRAVARGSSVDRRIRRALLAMRQDVKIESMDNLARQVGLSRGHFFRLFEESTQVPPRLYLNMLRFEKAVAELVQRDTPLNDIAETLGFSQASHFTRFFRDHSGASPSEFRRVGRTAEPSSVNQTFR